MKLLLTGAYKWTTEQIEHLKKCGWQVLYVEREDSNIEFQVEDIDAIVCNWFFVYHDICEFKQLKCIQILSAGLDRVPVDYVNKNNIALFSARGVYSIPMAEFTLCSVLQLYKQSAYFQKKQMNKTWEKNRNIMELYNKRICIIGVGSVGIEVGKRFAAFTDEVYGIDIAPRQNPYMKKVYSLDDLNREIEVSDVIVLTLPLTDVTRNMFSKEKFDKMKKNSIFVNIARGGLVDEDALLDALDEKLLGAALDVFQTEPLSEDSLLWTKNNILITPHNSFVSEKNDERMWEIIKENFQSPQRFVETS